MTTHRVHARPPHGPATQPEQTTDAARLAAHVEDAAHVRGGHADVLVWPRTEHEVAACIAGATRVLAIGAQSSLTGGATPRGGLLLSTERLRTLDASATSDGLRAGAGVTIAEIDAWTRAHGALYPPGPTWHGATIGGTIATNAAGAATFKYGSTRAWVDALTVVLATGDALDLQRGQVTAHADGYVEIVRAHDLVRVPTPRYRMPEVPKLSAGYYAAPGMDLMDLFIGSEGTLGIVTEATLRLEPVRPAACLVFVTFPERASALRFVDAVRTETLATWRNGDRDGLDVSAIEHLDARSLALLRADGADRRCNVSIPADAALALLVTLDLPQGTSGAQVYEALGGGSSTPGGLSRFVQLITAFGAADSAIVAAPGDGAAAARLLALREAVPLAVNQRVGAAARDVDARIEKTAADVIVPFDRFDELLTRVDAEFERRGLDGAVWGHISDGNIHPNVIPRHFADVEA
ncbi:MAG: FAD-binding oxidoreductase, partial [Vicinamibacterales bacterium]